ncbi:sensor histidine kinase [Vulcanococcus limneticus]|uniref:sensor histidine kinase n=1 Tax=Vulcanococcus limneticus TaxID=2170428 RepID=UPI00398C0075
MEHDQPAPGPGCGAAAARPLNPLVPLVAAGGFALASLALSWKQSQAIQAMAGLISHSQAVLVALSDVDRGVLRGDLAASLLRLGWLGTASTLDFSGAVTDRALAELQRLTVDNASQRLHIARLRSAITAARLSRETFSDRNLQSSMAVVLEEVKQIGEIEHLLMQQRGRALIDLQRNLLLLQAGNGVGVLLLLLLTAQFLQRERRRVVAAHGELVESEERFRHLFTCDTLGVAISRPGPDGAHPTLQVNQALADMLGTTRVGIEAKGLESFLLDDGQQRESEALETVLNGGQASARLTLQLRHANGAAVCIEETLFVRHGAHQEVQEVFRVLLNVTLVKSAEQALLEKVAYTRSLIETSLDPMAVINAAGKLDDVNEATIQATGLSRSLLVGRDFADCFTESERAGRAYQTAFAEGSVRDYPLTLRHNSGNLTPVLYNASTYCDASGQVLGVYAVARDISPIRRMEEQLRSLNGSLEQEVQERTAELTQANQELESFAYSISHDLRAPLRAIDGFSLKLLRGYGDRLDAEGRRLLQVVRDNAQRMGTLIDDLLRFSRLGRRELETTRVDMEALARTMASELLVLEGDRQIEFHCGQLPQAQGDPNLLREVWLNLLSNAIKFSRSRALAHITVDGAVEKSELSYWVKDDGAGFDMAYADKLFGVFQRLHRQDEFEGSGVGLALVQRILHCHWGHIEGEGHTDIGATFRFSLPLPPAPENRSASGASPP